MSVCCPTQQHGEQPMVTVMKQLLGDHVSVVGRPPTDARVELTDEGLLCQALAGADQVTQHLLVSLDCGCARANQGLKAQAFPVMSTRLGSANAELPYGEA